MQEEAFEVMEMTNSYCDTTRQAILQGDADGLLSIKLNKSLDQGGGLACAHAHFERVLDCSASTGCATRHAGQRTNWALTPMP